jgi:hexokinase
MLIEKLMSGLYLGECARRHLLTFSRRAGLFGPAPPPALETPGSFTTAHLAAVESDASPLRSGVKAALREAFGDGVMAGGELGLETLYMVRVLILVGWGALCVVY